MLSDSEVIAAADRLDTTDGAAKLTQSDVSDMVTNFRLLLGPLESRYPNLQEDLEALDDSTDSSKRAAKMAAILIRLINEDFGVATISSTLLNSDEEQRRLFLLYGFGLLYPIPLELISGDIYQRFLIGSRKSQTIDTITIP